MLNFRRVQLLKLTVRTWSIHVWKTFLSCEGPSYFQGLAGLVFGSAKEEPSKKVFDFFVHCWYHKTWNQFHHERFSHSIDFIIYFDLIFNHFLTHYSICKYSLYNNMEKLLWYKNIQILYIVQIWTNIHYQIIQIVQQHHLKWYQHYLPSNLSCWKMTLTTCDHFPNWESHGPKFLMQKIHVPTTNTHLLMCLI